MSDDLVLPYYDQTGDLLIGPGAKREAPLRGIGLPSLSSRMESKVDRARRFASEQSYKHAMVKVQAQQQQSQLVQLRESIRKQQALTMMCTLYIGSISFEIKEDNLKTAFSPFGPVKSVNMSRDQGTGLHKGYAFLEFEIPEAARLAEDQMNGVLMGGRNLRVGRPSNMPQAQLIIDQIIVEAKSYHRIYISSIHPDLSETDVLSVFEAFGQIKNCQLARVSPGGQHKGYGYIEYDNEQSVIDAVSSMNLFDLGGQYLRVGRAVTPPIEKLLSIAAQPTAKVLPSEAAKAAAAATAKIQAMEATKSATSLSSAPKITISKASISAGLVGTSPFTSAPPPVVSRPGMPPVGAQTLPTAGLPQPPLPPPSMPGRAPAGGPPPFRPPPGYPPIGYPVVRPVVGYPGFSMPPPVPPTAAAMGMGNAWGANGSSPVPPPAPAPPVPPPSASHVTGTPRVILRNMVTPADVDSGLEGEIKEECSKYGRVSTVHVHNDGSAVTITVTFVAMPDAINAKTELSGRYFDGKLIDAELAL